MAIKHIEGATDSALREVLKGHTKVFEEFGPMGTGKTTRANALAEKLHRQGKSVVVHDGLERGHEGGVRVYAK